MNGAEAIAEILKREGIEFLCCYPRHDLIEAAAKLGIRPIVCRQERVGMAIADGFSRTTNGKRMGVFVSQQGPGTENAFPGVAQAFSDNVPLLYIPGGDSLARRHKSPSFSAVDNYRHVTKWAAQVNQVERIPELFRRAFYQLRTGKGGPVLLEVPREIWTDEFEGDLNYTPVVGTRLAPAPEAIEKAARMLWDAKRPMIHAGQGVLYAEATDRLVEFAELLQAPVMTTMPGKSGFPENHPLALGASAVSTTKATSEFLQAADVVLGLGTSFTKTPYGKALPSGKTLIHASLDPADIHKDYEAAHAVIGDASLILDSLISAVKGLSGGKKRTQDDVGAAVQKIKKEWLAEWMPQLTSDETPINQYRIIWDLLHNVDAANTIITHDAGSPRDQVVPFWECTTPRTYLGWGKSTQLGYGLGLVMGAKLAEPDKLCVNIMGDAAIGMTGMDIETAVRSRIGILTIVFNNGIMAIEQAVMPFANQNFDANTVGGDYTKVAAGLGAWSKRVEAPDQFVPVLKEAIQATQQGRPALIECITKAGYDFSKYP